jgi:hypothetical protein
MKTLIAAITLLLPVLAYGQAASVQLYVHPHTYLTQKPFYVYRQLSDSLIATTIRVDSGQVIIASYADDRWAFILNQRFTYPLPASLSDISQIIPISPADNVTYTLFARQADLVLLPYEQPTAPAKRRRKRHL